MLKFSSQEIADSVLEKIALDPNTVARLWKLKLRSLLKDKFGTPFAIGAPALTVESELASMYPLSAQVMSELRRISGDVPELTTKEIQDLILSGVLR